MPEAERGLLGIAIDPEFPQQPWVYLYLSDAADGVNRIVRVRAEGNRGGAPETLLDGLDSAAGYHNGGDLVFGADGSLFASWEKRTTPSGRRTPTTSAARSSG